MPDIDDFVADIEITLADGSVIEATGFLVGPNDLLTAAHNVHDGNDYLINTIYKGATYKVYFKDGVYQSDVDWFFAGDEYSHSTDWSDDMALITLSEPIGNILGWMDYTSSLSYHDDFLNVAGFSLENTYGSAYDGDTLHGDFVDVEYWYLSGVIKYESYEIFGGSSGGPVYVYDSSTNERVAVGIHVAGNNYLNIGTTGNLLTSADVYWISKNIHNNGDGVSPTIIGFGGDDFILGNEQDNFLSGRGGNDTLYGLSGKDTMYGGGGADKLFGGSDRDILKGGDGRDRLIGEAGNDLLIGGSERDILKGGAGRDRLIGEGGNDDLNGGKEEDALKGGAGSDTLYGGRGNDDLNGGKERDILKGGIGSDTLNGGRGNDMLYGQSGYDTFKFQGNWGKDTIKDFSLNGREDIDVSQITAINNYSDLKQNHMYQDSNGNTVIYVGLNEIIIENVRIGDLEKSDFIF